MSVALARGLGLAYYSIRRRHTAGESVTLARRDACGVSLAAYPLTSADAPVEPALTGVLRGDVADLLDRRRRFDPRLSGSERADISRPAFSSSAI